MDKIVSSPFSKEGLKNFDRIFRKGKQHPQRLCCSERPGQDDTSAPLGVTSDENVDWGEFKTTVCCTDDPYFGG